MATIVYLDADDEITSAAARIRTADEGRVALVLPYGSRIATSRINFRLLAREAQTRDRRLGIVTGDASTRALAASAGLPVFFSVGEYEASLTPAREVAAASLGADLETPPGPAAAAARNGRRKRRAAAPPPPPPEPDEEDVGDEEELGAEPEEVDPGSPASERSRRIPVVGRRGFARPELTLPWRDMSFEWPASWRRPAAGRAGVAVALAVLALVVVVGGVGAWLLLPSASIVVIPREEIVGPLTLSVRADPAATAVDPVGGVIPAQRLTFDLAASDSFPATGVRIQETKSTGRVRFRSYDTGSANTIPAGSIVSTGSGTQFRTLASVRLGRADLVGESSVVPSSVTVGVEAVMAGAAANVAANSITVVPRTEDPEITKVTNLAPTAGGTHEEFPVVKESDVAAALTRLGIDLAAQLDAAIADPSNEPERTRLFPATKSLSIPVPTVDPASLAGQEIPSFDLGVTAAGSVVAVDAGPVVTVADRQLRQEVPADHRLIDGSADVEIGEPAIEGEVILFPVTARATQVRLLDPRALLAAVKGRTVAEARTVLEQYGEVRLSVWPDWVTSIPGFDPRVDLRVVTAAGEDATLRPTPAPAVTPAASPGAS